MFLEYFLFVVIKNRDSEFFCYRIVTYGPYYKQIQCREHGTAYKCIFCKSVKALSKFYRLMRKRLAKSVWTPKFFFSKSIAFISSLLDLYCARALELLMPDVIGFQLFPLRSMVTCFIFFNYGTIISSSHYFYYKLNYPLGLFCC